MSLCLRPSPSSPAHVGHPLRGSGDPPFPYHWRKGDARDSADQLHQGAIADVALTRWEVPLGGVVISWGKGRKKGISEGPKLLPFSPLAPPHSQAGFVGMVGGSPPRGVTGGHPHQCLTPGTGAK